eukprot:COSAG01_NODE_53596_length_338_cov_0.644351_1_plen_23_part_10
MKKMGKGKVNWGNIKKKFIEMQE